VWLYGLQQLGLQFERKGGTSLSKGCGFIERFSKDVDTPHRAAN
jgi:predicted nucleotidyltransferase component of viral defense system